VRGAILYAFSNRAMAFWVMGLRLLPNSAQGCPSISASCCTMTALDSLSTPESVNIARMSASS
jgi:hypothetical protein